MQRIDDAQAGEYLINYLQTSEYLISLFIEGFVDENQVSLYGKFFSVEIDDALRMLAKEDSNMDILASDLAETLRKIAIRLAGIPTISLLNNLWSEKIRDNDFLNPYETIILFSMFRSSIETLFQIV